MKEICINDHLKDTETDLATAVACSLMEAGDSDAYLYLAEGIYHVYPDRTYRKFYAVSNNDPGVKQILFPLIGKKDITIDGNGSHLIMHGRITAFAIDGSSNIKIKNFKISQARPFFTQGVIVSSEPGMVELEIDSSVFPFTIANSRFTAIGHDWASSEIHNYLEYSIETRCVEYDTGDHYGNARHVTAALTDKGTVKLFTGSNEIHRPGNVLVLDHEKRNAPAVFINQSRNIDICSMDIYGSSAMALIAQLSADLTIDGLKVVPQPGSGFMVSASADATHFVNCSGKIRMQNCVFEGQLDDATNVHGIYTTVEEVLSENLVVLRLNHHQQYGIKYLRGGDRVEFSDTRNLQPTVYGVVKDCRLLGDRLLLTEFSEVSGKVMKGMAAENATTSADVHIVNCVVGKNRARGFLISTRGNVLIEKCELSPGGAGILVAGDANYWYESGRVNNLVIRDNVFVNCRRYIHWGRAVISIDPVIQESPDNKYYHTNISILNNHFVLTDKAVLYARDTHGLVFKDNTFEMTCDYPLRHIDGPAVHLSNCMNVEQDETGDELCVG